MENITKPYPVTELTDTVCTVRVDLPATPERVFHALSSKDVTRWWVRPGVFDTREWTGDVQVGGRWNGSGVIRDAPYTIDGEFLEVDPPRRLVHTWHAGGAPGATTVSYDLEPIAGGTRVTLRQSGFPSREVCANFATGWETSFVRLAELLADEGSTRR